MKVKIQNGEYSVRIYQKLDESMLEIWKNLYLTVSGNYNLSPDWCKYWVKHFGSGKELYIISFYRNNDIVLLAPFYIRKDTLSLIGTNPDLIDEFSILYTDISYLDELITYIFNKKLSLDFKYININSNFAKIFLKKLEQNQFLTKKIDGFFVKPYVKPEINIKDSIKHNVKRRTSSAKNKFKDNICFENNTSKNQYYFEEFISFHNKRWQGEFINNNHLNAFFRDLFLNTDMTSLSRLFLQKSNTSLSYILSFTGSNYGLYTVLTSFDDNFSLLSPGLLAFYYLISESKLYKFKFIDLGRGGLDYKYKFTNDYHLLLNVSATINWKKHSLIYNLLKQAKRYFISFASKLYTQVRT